MKFSMTVLVAVLAFAACKKDKGDAALDKMSSFKDQACACKDKACIDKVQGDMIKWASEQKDMENMKPTEAQKKRGKEITDAMEACTTKIEEAEGGAKAKEAMTKMTAYADQMCACKDTACATKVSDEMTAWSKEMASSGTSAPKMSEEDTKKATEIGMRMAECMQTAMGAGAAAGSAAAGSADGSAAAGSAAAGSATK